MDPLVRGVVTYLRTVEARLAEEPGDGTAADDDAAEAWYELCFEVDDTEVLAEVLREVAHAIPLDPAMCWRLIDGPLAELEKLPDGQVIIDRMIAVDERFAAVHRLGKAEDERLHAPPAGGSAPGGRTLWRETRLDLLSFVVDLVSGWSGATRDVTCSVWVDDAGLHVDNPQRGLKDQYARARPLLWSEIAGVQEGAGDELARIRLRDGTCIVLGPGHNPRGRRKQEIRARRLALLRAAVAERAER